LDGVLSHVWRKQWSMILLVYSISGSVQARSVGKRLAQGRY